MGCCLFKDASSHHLQERTEMVHATRPQAAECETRVVVDDAAAAKASRLELVRTTCRQWIATERVVEQKMMCAICIDGIDAGASLLTLPCFHVFHQSCAEDWLQRSENLVCPTCETSIRATARR